MTPERNATAGIARPRRIATIVGARPQFIKAFPLSRLLRQRGEFEEILVHTGQHFHQNMSDVFFAELEIEAPRYSLDIHGGGHGAMTGRMLGAIEDILVREQPDAVLVYGDTNSTLAGGLAAAKCNVPVIHVEAGLRSHNRAMPEEINRVVVDHLSSLLFCPTQRAVDNLAREGISIGVHQVGDLMFDAVRMAAPLATRSDILKRLGLEEKKYGVATFHRQENLASKDRMERIVAYLREEARVQPLVVPLHPRTRDAMEKERVDFASDRILVTAPLGYLDMWQLTRSAAIVLTDSGGLQREAFFFRVPCVTLRDETEWVETIEHGWNRLWTSEYFAPREEGRHDAVGHAAELILGVLARELPPPKSA